jgi:hypothetical protein
MNVIISVGYVVLFGAESFAFQFATQKFKDQDVSNYNFARGPVWV